MHLETRTQAVAVRITPETVIIRLIVIVTLIPHALNKKIVSAVDHESQPPTRAEHVPVPVVVMEIRYIIEVQAFKGSTHAQFGLSDLITGS